MPGILSRADARAGPGRAAARRFFRPVAARILPAIRRGIAAGSIARPLLRPGRRGGLARRLLVEGLPGNPEGVDRRRHSAIEDHLRDDLGDFLLCDPDMQCAGDMSPDHLWAVAKNHQGGDGAKAARFQINGRAVVDLAVNHRVDEPHDLWGQLGHRLWGLRVVVRPIVAHAKACGGLVQACREDFAVLFRFRFLFRVRVCVRAVGAHIRVVFVVKAGCHNALQSVAVC